MHLSQNPSVLGLMKATEFTQNRLLSKYLFRFKEPEATNEKPFSIKKLQ